MQYAALFIWITLCLILGGMMHYVMAGALVHRSVQVLAAPGMVVRKLTMTVTALVCGGTVTRVSMYELSSRDIDFRADGVASVGKALAPLAPLFGGAVALMALNGMFGSPIGLSCAPPALASLDGGGLKGFFVGTWMLLSGVVREGIDADWGNPRLWVLSALVFSFALGASSPLERVREAIVGAALVSVALALLSTIAVRRAGVMAASPGWFSAADEFLIESAGIAFVMMVYGMFAALAVGVAVRLGEVVFGRGGARRSPPRTGSRSEADEPPARRAA